MKCRFARRNSSMEFKCLMDSGECQLQIPDPYICRAFYKKGPKVTGKEKLYTVKYTSIPESNYAGIDVNYYVHVFADNKKEAKMFVERTYHRIRDIKVLDIVKCLDINDIKKVMINGFTIYTYNDIPLIKGKNNIWSDNNEIVTQKLHNVIFNNFAITERKLIVQFTNKLGEQHQYCFPISKELLKLL